MSTILKIEMFDPSAMWRDLAPDQRDKIGAAALAVVAAGNMAEYVDEATDHDNEAWDLAVTALHDSVNETPVSATSGNTVFIPDLNAIGIAQCRVCRCTKDHACEGGCHWIKPGLCSACVPSGTA
jgi:hypothetical protein